MFKSIQGSSVIALFPDEGVPRGIFAWPAPVPAEFPSRIHGCGFPAKFPRVDYIFYYYLIIFKIFNNHPSNFFRGGRKEFKHEMTPKRVSFRVWHV